MWIITGHLKIPSCISIAHAFYVYLYSHFELNCQATIYRRHKIACSCQDGSVHSPLVLLITLRLRGMKWYSYSCCAHYSSSSPAPCSLTCFFAPEGGMSLHCLRFEVKNKEGRSLDVAGEKMAQGLSTSCFFGLRSPLPDPK